MESKLLKLLRDFLLVFYFIFYIWLSRLSSKKVENNSLWIWNWSAEENLVVNNKDSRVLMSSNSIGLIVAPCKFDVLKTSICALEASLLGQIFVLRTTNLSGATINRHFSTETLYCLHSSSSYIVIGVIRITFLFVSRHVMACVFKMNVLNQ